MIKNDYNSFYMKNDFKTFVLADKCFILSLIKFLNIPKNSYILDLPCGTGKFSCYFADYSMNVLGVDISHIAINIAKKKYKNATFIKADATNNNFYLDRTFDVLFCHGFSIFNDYPNVIIRKISPILNYINHNGYFIFGKTSNLYDKSPILGKSRTDYDIDTYKNIFLSINKLTLVGSYTLQPHLFIIFKHYTFNRIFSNICSYITYKTKIPLRVYLILKKK